MLTGGRPNSLGRTEEAVEMVLAERSRLRELFKCLYSDDALVRLRTGDALEKICRRRPVWFSAYVPRLLSEMGAIDQASVQWHLAQILTQVKLDRMQRRRAIAWLWRTLEATDDWIVISEVLTALTFFAGSDKAVRKRLPAALRKTQRDPRKAVARRATKLLTELESTG